MFWNDISQGSYTPGKKWTLNMKCFEIGMLKGLRYGLISWTLNMKCFEITLKAF